MNADELDQAYAQLSQALTRLPREASELFLARLVLLLVSSSTDVTAVSRDIAAAETDLWSYGGRNGGTEQRQTSA